MTPFHLPRRKGAGPCECKCGCGEMVDRSKNEAKMYVDTNHYLKMLRDRTKAKREAREAVEHKTPRGPYAKKTMLT